MNIELNNHDQGKRPSEVWPTDRVIVMYENKRLAVKAAINVCWYDVTAWNFADRRAVSDDNEK